MGDGGGSVAALEQQFPIEAYRVQPVSQDGRVGAEMI